MHLKFKIFLRSVLKNRWAYFINTLSQVAGMSCLCLSILYIFNEISHDQGITNSKRIVNVTTVIKENDSQSHLASVNGFLVPEWRHSLPEIEEFLRLKKLEPSSKVVINSESNLQYFDQDVFLFSDVSILDMFSLETVIGNSKSALRSPNSVVLTESLSKKYFNTIDVLGKEIQVNGESYTVTAVIKDIPSNYALQFNGLLSFNEADYYTLQWAHVFLLLKSPLPNEELEELQLKLNKVARDQLEGQFNEDVLDIYLLLEHYEDMYFSEIKQYELIRKGNRNHLLIIITITILMALLMFFSNVNFFVVQGLRRHKEIGVLSLFGEDIKSLFFKSIIETISTSLIAVLITALLLISFSNDLEALLNHDVSVIQLSVVIVILGMLFGFGSGLYPSLYFSRVKINVWLKGLVVGEKINSVRHALLFAQFFISLVVILFTLGINNQLVFMQEMNLGFSKERVIVVDVPDDPYVQKNISFFIKGLSELPAVGEISICGLESFPGKTPRLEMFSLNSDDEKKISFIEVDENYFTALDIDLIAGRNFQSPPLTTEFIVNEKFVKEYGLVDPIGTKLSKYGRKGEIIGIVQDFHIESIHKPIEPLIMYKTFQSASHLLIRLKSTNNLQGQIATFQRLWEQSFEQHSLGFRYLDEVYDSQYLKERILSSQFNVLSIAIIIVSVGGIFSFSSLVLQQRKRELALRKCFGASSIHITAILLKTPLALTSIASIISLPIVWLMILLWLNDFTYKETVNLFVFTPGILLLFSIVILSYFLLAVKVNRNYQVSFIQQD